jgi:hypothetical protein
MGIWDDYGSGRYQQYYSRRGQYNISFKNEDAFFAQGCLQRTQTMSAYLDGGAAVVTVEYDKAPISFGLKDRTYKHNHIQLARLVVFPGDSISQKNGEMGTLFDAAVLGVYIHGLAGDIGAEKFGQVSLMTTDIIDALPDAFLIQ